MKAYFNLTAYILILLNLCSCNPDVFIDDFRSSTSRLTLDGNGDVAVVSFKFSNWYLLEMRSFDSGFSYSYKMYDENDKLITESQFPYIKGLGKIVCDEQFTDFVIERKDPKELKITVGENVRSAPFKLSLLVGNEYETQEIYVDILPSDRYVFDHITYSLDGYYYSHESEDKKSLIVNNNTDSPTSILFTPYEDVHHEVSFQSDSPEAFRLLGEDKLTVEIPSIENRRLVMSGVQAQYVSKPQALPLPFPGTEQVTVSVAAHTQKRITLMLTYDWFETEYTLYAFHPKTKKQRIITGTLQSRVPESYFIKRENIK
ncbi:MAG: hypothetical protein RSB62_09515 [Bacteroides sp.]